MRIVPTLFAVLFILLPLSAPFLAQGAGGVVKGTTVFSQNGIRLEGAKGELEGVARTETDGGGRFLFSSVPAGFYKIEASKKGFPTNNRALLVKPDRVQSLDIILPGTATPSLSAQTTVVPLMRQGAAIFVRVRIPGNMDAIFLVDTGATYSTLSIHLAEQIGLRQRSDGLSVTVQTASGTLKAPLVFLPSLAIGDFEEKGIEALILDLPSGGDEEGILGLSFLNRFRYTIDPGANELILRR